MSLYLAEGTLQGLGPAGVAAVQRALSVVCRRLRARGVPVHYVCGQYVADQGRFVCVVAAPSAADVRSALEHAQIGTARVASIFDVRSAQPSEPPPARRSATHAAT